MFYQTTTRRIEGWRDDRAGLEFGWAGFLALWECVKLELWWWGLDMGSGGLAGVLWTLLGTGGSAVRFSSPVAWARPQGAPGWAVGSLLGAGGPEER